MLPGARYPAQSEPILPAVTRINHNIITSTVDVSSTYTTIVTEDSDVDDSFLPSCPALSDYGSVPEPHSPLHGHPFLRQTGVHLANKQSE